jgi:ABC-type spermidine/putrescine transport system permease subunit I
MRDRNATARGWLLSLPGLAFLLVFFALPLLVLLRVSVFEGGGRSGFGIGGGGFYKPGTWSLEAYRGLFADAYFSDVLRFTIRFGLHAALLSVLLGFVLALLISRLQGWQRGLALGLVFLPKLANVLVMVYGLQLLLGDIGPVNRLLAALHTGVDALPLLHGYTGALIGEVYLVLPYAVLLLVATLDRIDPLLRPAARGLGAGTLQTFCRVTLPLALPGLSTTLVLCAVFGFGAFVSPYVLGSPDEFTLSIDIQRQAFENLNWPRAAAEAVMMLVTLSVVGLLYRAGLMGLRSGRASHDAAKASER